MGFIILVLDKSIHFSILVCNTGISVINAMAVGTLLKSDITLSSPLHGPFHPQVINNSEMVRRESLRGDKSPDLRLPRHPHASNGLQRVQNKGFISSRIRVTYWYQTKLCIHDAHIPSTSYKHKLPRSFPGRSRHSQEAPYNHLCSC